MARNAILIPNGVDLPSEARTPRTDVPSILSVGTICERKGQDLLVEALGQIKDLRWNCVLVGGRSSMFQHWLEDRISALDLADRIRIVPETSDVEGFYQEANIAVIASREESAPLVSLEALARGIPLVSTDAFGLGEQLNESEAALVVPTSSVEHLAAALRNVLTESDVRERMSRNGPLWIERHFSRDRMLERYKTEFEKLLA